MTHPSTSLPHPRREAMLIAAAWGAVALVAAVQTVAMVRLEGGRAGVATALVQRLSIIPLWAAATPAVLRSARRFPVVEGRGEARRVSLPHLALHATLGALFVVLANVLIRVPEAMGAGGTGAALLLRGTMQGLTLYFPAPLLVYGVIVAVGHVAVGHVAVGHVAAPPARGQTAAEAGAADEGAAPGRTDDGDAAEWGDRDVGGGPPRGEEAKAPPPADGSLGDAAAEAEHLPVRQWNRVYLVPVEEIDWIEAEDNYVVVHAAGQHYRGRERIADVEARLDRRRFVRIHRSTIVHAARIREVQPLTHGDHAVILQDGTVLRVARSRRRALEEALAMELW